MCSSTPSSTAVGAVAAGGRGGCVVRVKGLPQLRTWPRTRSERCLVAAGGRLGGLAAPARPVAAVPGRRRLGRGGFGGRRAGGRRADGREPHAHAPLLGVDLDRRPPLALRGLPGA